MTIKFSNFGIIGAVCGVSLVINFFALPLYNIADSLQEKERKTAKALEFRVKRIKKAFKGNEQFMMLSTYYKENDYNPLYVLRSSLSILIEIPFFIAAYHYLSNCDALKGSSFWIFKDLGSPDGLLHIGNFPIHVLPIIMTLINFVSGAIYTKEAPFKEKIQLYIVAILFLVLLYTSPSGLVIYWILNNVFSLIKNIVMKMKHPGRILHAVLSVIFLSAAGYFFAKDGMLWKKLFFLTVAGFITLLPFIKNIFLKLFNKTKVDFKKANIFNLLFCGLALALLCGLLLPASVISTSPREFSYLGSTDSPLSYIYTSFTIFLGFFVFWPTVIYTMFNENVKKIECNIFLFILIIAFTNAFICKPNLTEVTSILTYNINSSSKIIHLISLVLLLFSIVISLALQKVKRNFLSLVFISICIAEFTFGFTKLDIIRKSFNDYKISRDTIAENNNSESKQSFAPVYNLSKTGKNVVVLFLDRAIGSFPPYIFETIPELKEKYKGFTYYPNTLSFGRHTVFGFPPLAGGYEYTQENINKRDTELLVSKHNEAMLVMPKLFSDAGFDVTFTDPPFSNYRWKGDLTPFKDFPEMHVLELQGKFSQLYRQEIHYYKNKQPDLLCRKNIISFSVLQIISPFFRPILYKFGVSFDEDYSKFFDQISSLYYLPQITDFYNNKDSFVFIDNETCHNTVFLDADSYRLPSKRTSSALGTYKPASDDEAADFLTNAAALLQLGKWFDYLRQNDCYDNTRIIIVSDHGYMHKYSDFKNFKNPVIPSSYNPLFMVKDFNCNDELATDMSFMTNADTLFFAKRDLNISAKNPFTQKTFTQEKENVHVYPAGFSNEYNGELIRDKTQFVLNKKEGWNVSDNIFDEKNWIPLTEWEELNRGEN